MAEAAVDAACEQLGGPRPCRTAEVPLAGSESHELYQISHRLAAREPVPQAEEIICECELITRSRLEEAIKQRDTTSLDDIRRLLRLAMGPCQGGFCIYRATGILHQGGQVDQAGANQTLLDFLEERWKGVHPILHGDQLRQARLDDWIFQGILDVEHLPV
jgi:glycerol-3-phosphate dehydrogenase